MAVRFKCGSALRLVVPEGPSADSSTDENEERGDGEKSALQLLRCRAVLDEAPNDVVAVDQIGKKSGSYDELMNQLLVAILKVSRLHAKQYTPVPLTTYLHSEPHRILTSAVTRLIKTLAKAYGESNPEGGIATSECRLIRSHQNPNDT